MHIPASLVFNTVLQESGLAMVTVASFLLG